MNTLKTLALALLCSFAAYGQAVTIGAAAFNGTGLNDATSGGRYVTAPANAVYLVTITGAGTPNQFQWSKNGGGFSSSINITGAVQSITDGVTITFAATTGHTLGDSWSITTTASGSGNASSFIQRGIGARFRSVEDKLREMVSVTDFGASPLLADNSTVISGALAGGQHALFPISAGLLSSAGTVTVGHGRGLYGPAPFSLSGLKYSGSGDIIGNISNTSYQTLKNFSLRTTTAANGIHLNGDGTTYNVANSEISGIDFGDHTNTYSGSAILLESTFNGHVFNNIITPTATYGIKFSGVSGGQKFNTTDVVEGNLVQSDTQAGFYCEYSCSDLRISNNVFEAHSRKGVWLAGGPQYNVELSGNHFEANSLATPDYDIYVQPAGSTTYPSITSGTVKITGNSFSSPYALGAIYIAATTHPVISDNNCVATGGSGTGIFLGPGVVNASVFNNKGCQLQTEAGVPISDAASAITFENLMAWSTDLTNGAWSLSGPATLDTAGSPTFYGSPAFNLNLNTASSMSNSIGIAGGYSTSPAGHYYQAGVWARTDTGTAQAQVRIFTTYAVYTGTVAGPVETITPQWQFIHISATTSASDTGSAIYGEFRFWPASGSPTKIIIARPWLCADTMSCGYAPTGAVPILKSVEPVGMAVPVPLMDTFASTAVRDTLLINGAITGAVSGTPSGLGGIAYLDGGGTVRARESVIMDDPYNTGSTHFDWSVTNGVTLHNSMRLDKLGNLQLLNGALQVAGSYGISSTGVGAMAGGTTITDTFASTSTRDSLLVNATITGAASGTPSALGGAAYIDGGGSVRARESITMDDPYNTGSSHWDWWATNGVTLHDYMRLDKLGNLSLLAGDLKLSGSYGITQGGVGTFSSGTTINGIAVGGSSGVVAGTYPSTSTGTVQFAVDALGRITGASPSSAGATGTVTFTVSCTPSTGLACANSTCATLGDKITVVTSVSCSLSPNTLSFVNGFKQ